MNYTMLLGSVVLSSCAGLSPAEQSYTTEIAKSMSVCDVMIKPEMYLGKEVLLRGIYLAEPHQAIMYGKECSKNEIDVVGSVEVANDALAERILRAAIRKDRSARIPAVFHGVLYARPLISGCDKNYCFRYQLREAKLLAAHPPEGLP